jgi:hypothetical protein
MVFITHIRQAGGRGHEHITDVKWRDPADGKVGESSVPIMVAWIENKGGKAKVTDGQRTVDVGVIKAQPPYLRTHADGVWTDNLLALPRF